MTIKSVGLVWIVVKDFKKAIDFYSKTVGLKLVEKNDQYGWAEFQGADGQGRLGVAQEHPQHAIVKPGGNGVMTFEVENIEAAIKDMEKKGAKAVGKLEVVPGHVKMQTYMDQDGNHFQLCEVIGMK